MSFFCLDKALVCRNFWAEHPLTTIWWLDHLMFWRLDWPGSATLESFVFSPSGLSRILLLVWENMKAPRPTSCFLWLLFLVVVFFVSLSYSLLFFLFKSSSLSLNLMFYCIIYIPFEHCIYCIVLISPWRYNYLGLTLWFDPCLNNKRHKPMEAEEKINTIKLQTKYVSPPQTKNIHIETEDTS